ncbi:hypothetical protein GCM10027566_16730 [Arachidicoccus ginsenosidivorans]
MDACHLDHHDTSFYYSDNKAAKEIICGRNKKMDCGDAIILHTDSFVFWLPADPSNAGDNAFK